MKSAATQIKPPALELIRADARRALQEDIGRADASAALLPADAAAVVDVVFRESAILAGAPWFDACLRELDPDVHITWQHHDGNRVNADTTLCTVAGKARALLSAERSALNFLQTLSATATVTASFVGALGDSATRILDSRKTLPGLRAAQKYAVRCGGGSNHRMGLYDAILIKENHIAVAGSIGAAVRAARAAHPALMLEVEVENMHELEQALDAKVERIMLDDFDNNAIRAAVKRVDGQVPLEVSGNVSLQRVTELATLGVDYISVGALTKNIRAIDISMRVRAK